MPSELILVTGASGFLGAHIVQQLLDNNYRVRAVARGAKVDQLKDSYAKYGDQFEVVAVADVATSQLSDAVKGVDAVIHTAASMTAGAEEILKSILDGTANVIDQAYKAGVKRFVITSSIITVLNARNSFTDKDWNPVTKEHLIKGEKSSAYAIAKTEAERAVWDFADKNPDVEITTVNPPFIYGPFAPRFTVPEPNYAALSTNNYIYRMLTPDGSYPGFPGYADIRDIARVHVGALKSPPTSVVGRKRILMCGDETNFQTVVPLLLQERPALKDRLVPADKAPAFPIYKLPIDAKRVEEVTGVKVDSYKTWKETILDTVDSLLALEEQWKSKGFTVTVPTSLDF